MLSRHIIRNYRNSKRLFLLIFVSIIIQNANSQPGRIIQNLKFGFGGGINFSMIDAANEFELYEDLAGNTSSNEYSGVFQNLGNQYFFLAEYHVDGLVIGLRPGTYSYKFSRENILYFENSEVLQDNDFSLRYFSIPLEVKYLLNTNRLQPYIGGVLTWATLLASGENENLDFINNRLAMGAAAGAYYETGFMTVLMSLVYNHGIHVITRKDSRYNISISEPYSQSDLRLNDLNLNLSLLFSLEKKRFRSNMKCPYPQR